MAGSVRHIQTQMTAVMNFLPFNEFHKIDLKP